MRHGPRFSLLVSSYVLLAVVSACGKASDDRVQVASSGPHTSDKGSVELPEAKPCVGTPELNCYAVKMPLDHESAESPRTTVTFGYKAATVESREVLLVLFGGPGDPGVYSLGKWLTRVSPELKKRFNIVTMDLRGVQGSEQMDCPQAASDFSFVPPWTYVAEETKALAEGAEAAVNSCLKELNRSPEVIRFYNSKQAAADLETFRKLMGFSQWNIYSLSYGTQLAQTYVAQYPGKTLSLVLDGAVDLTVGLLDYGRDLALAQNKIFADLDSYCADTSACRTAFSKSGLMKKPTEVYDEIFEKLMIEVAPIVFKGEDSKEVSSSLSAYDFEFALSGSVSNPKARARFLWALAQADQAGDFAPLYRIADGRPEPFANIETKPVAPPVPGQETPRMSNGVFWTFICNDYGSPAGRNFEERFGKFVANAEPYLEEGVRIHAPFFSETVCAAWPQVATDIGRPSPFKGEGVPTLVIGAEADANVPYVHSERIAQHLDQGALITVKGSQHVSYSYHITCVNEAVDRLLLEARLPEQKNLLCHDLFVDTWPQK